MLAVQEMYTELGEVSARTSQLALELDMSMTKLKATRTQWLRRLTGQCPVCGDYCGPKTTCKRHENSRESLVPTAPVMESILQQLPKEAVVFRQQCPTCRHVTPFTAARVVWLFHRGRPIPHVAECRWCVMARKPLTSKPLAKLGEVAHGGR
jgi:hypothetical protein